VAAVGERRAAPGRRAIAAITLGNGLEFYDFTVYSFFAVLIGKLFFPVGGTMGQLMLSLATFGVGFIARPLGGVLVGLYADRAGRKPAMALTLWMMGLGSALFVAAPTYAQAGWLAPALIVVARLVQGFAVGGELGASSAMLMEYADDDSRGYFGSWQLFSQGASVLLGALIGLTLTNTLSPEALESWGWRIPFAIGILVILAGLYIRRHLDETGVVQEDGAPRQEHAGLCEIFTRYWRMVVAGVLITIGGTSATYIVLHHDQLRHLGAEDPGRGQHGGRLCGRTGAGGAVCVRGQVVGPDRTQTAYPLVAYRDAGRDLPGLPAAQCSADPARAAGRCRRAVTDAGAERRAVSGNALRTVSAAHPCDWHVDRVLHWRAGVWWFRAVPGHLVDRRDRQCECPRAICDRLWHRIAGGLGHGRGNGWQATELSDRDPGGSASGVKRRAKRCLIAIARASQRAACSRFSASVRYLSTGCSGRST
jgi:MFS family permease